MLRKLLLGVVVLYMIFAIMMVKYQDEVYEDFIADEKEEAYPAILEQVHEVYTFVPAERREMVARSITDCLMESITDRYTAGDHLKVMLTFGLVTENYEPSNLNIPEEESQACGIQALVEGMGN